MIFFLMKEASEEYLLSKKVIWEILFLQNNVFENVNHIFKNTILKILYSLKDEN